MEALVDLEVCEVHPRRFRIEIDEFAAEREVEPGSYALRFTDAGRSVPLPDPLAALAADFVGCATRGRDERAGLRRDEIAARAALLESLVRAWPGGPGA